MSGSITISVHTKVCLYGYVIAAGTPGLTQMQNKQLFDIHEYLNKHEWVVTYKHGITSKDEDNLTIRKCKACGAKEYGRENWDAEWHWLKNNPYEKQT